MQCVTLSFFLCHLTSGLDLQLVADVLEVRQSCRVGDLHVHGRPHGGSQVRRTESKVAQVIHLSEWHTTLLNVIGSLYEN